VVGAPLGFDFGNWSSALGATLLVAAGDRALELSLGAGEAAGARAASSRARLDAEVLGVAGAATALLLAFLFRFVLRGVAVGAAVHTFPMQRLEEASAAHLRAALAPPLAAAATALAALAGALLAAERALLAAALRGSAGSRAALRGAYARAHRALFPYAELDRSLTPQAFQGLQASLQQHMTRALSHSSVRSLRRGLSVHSLRSLIPELAEAAERAEAAAHAQAEKTHAEFDPTAWFPLLDALPDAPPRRLAMGDPEAATLYVPFYGPLPHAHPLPRAARAVLLAAPWALLTDVSSLVAAGAALALADPAGAPALAAAAELELAFAAATAVLALDLAARLVALGVASQPGALLRDPWAVLDALLLSCSLAYLLEPDTEPAGASVMRTTAVFRLALLVRPRGAHALRGGANEGLRALHAALGSVLRWAPIALLPAAVAFALLAVVGTQLLGGALRACRAAGAVDPARGAAACIGVAATGPTLRDPIPPSLVVPPEPLGYLTPRAWDNPAAHFDSFGAAAFALARVATGKWSALLAAARAADAPGAPPRGDARPDALVFVALALALSALLADGALAALVIQSVRCGTKPLASAKERHLDVVDRVVRLVRPKRPRLWPQGRARRALRALVRHAWYRRAIYVLNGSNSVFLLMEHAPLAAEWSAFFQAQTHFFFAVLCLETVLALAAFGPRNFAAVPFHLLDLALIAASAAGYVWGSGAAVAWGKLPEGTGWAVPSFLRVLRTLRLFPIAFRTHRPLAALSQAMVFSLPLALPALLLLLLVVLAFSAVGIALFRGAAPGRELGAVANFDSLPRALLSCALVAAGDDWHRLSDDLAAAPPRCTPAAALASPVPVDLWRYYSPGGDCGSPLAPVFFLALRGASCGLLLALLVGAVVAAVEFVAAKRAGLGPFSARRVCVEDALQGFADHWRLFDPASTGRMKMALVPLLLRQLPRPLGFARRSKLQPLTAIQQAQQERIVAELQVVAGICERLTPTHLSWAGALGAVRRGIFRLCCPCLVSRGGGARRKRAAKPVEVEAAVRAAGPDEDELRVEADRFWLVNAGKLARTYAPQGRVRAFIASLACGESVSYEQVASAVLATKVPDLLSDERRAARRPLDEAIDAVLAAHKIARFIRFWQTADERRAAAAEARTVLWRRWALEQLRERAGLIFSLTAMGFGTWAEVKPVVVAEPEKMEAEVELDTVDRLIRETRENVRALRKAGGDDATLLATLQSLRGRRGKVLTKVRAIEAERAAKRRAEEEVKAKMAARVRSLCAKGQRMLADAEELMASVLGIMGPLQVRQPRCPGVAVPP